MPGTCGICGERVVQQTNSDGSYKGACVDCKESFARPPRHVDQCDANSCVVCKDYQREKGA